jgi:hypothetical protein
VTVPRSRSTRLRRSPASSPSAAHRRRPPGPAPDTAPAPARRWRPPGPRWRSASPVRPRWRPADAAGVDCDEPGLHRRPQDAGQQPVGLGAGRLADAIGLQLGQPGPHGQRVDPGQRVGPERRPQVPLQDASVAVLGVGPQVHRAVQPAVQFRLPQVCGLQFRLPQVRPLQVRLLQVHFLQIRPPQVRLPRPDRRRRRASDGDRPLPRHLQPHPATRSSRRLNAAPGLPRHVAQRPTEGPVTATRHRAGLTRHPVAEDGGRRLRAPPLCRWFAVRHHLGRRPLVPWDMVDGVAATRS